MLVIVNIFRILKQSNQILQHYLVRMSAQQNYAKFDSRVAEESMDQAYAPSPMGAYEYDYGYANTSGMALMQAGRNFFDGVVSLLQVALVIGIILYFVYIVISRISKWGKQTTEEIAKLFKRVGKQIQSFGKWIAKMWRGLWKRVRHHIGRSILIVIWICLINTVSNVFQGESKILKMVKIQNGYVGVDLKNEKVLEPGRHFYSPLMSDVFMSVTSVFDFEIVAVTANTKEDMFVELDYRVGFKLMKDDLIPFYKKYGAKDIRSVASDVVMPTVLEVLKWVIKEYSFKDISSKHQEIKKRTLEETNKVLKAMGIEVNDINLLDIRLPESYTKSIEDLENAENALKLAEAELEKEKKAAEKDLIKAENGKKIKIIEAEWIAEYNNIINSTRLTDQMLELKKIENETKKIEKRDGKLPSSEDRRNYVELEK